MNYTAHAPVIEIKNDPDYANDDVEGVTAAITEFKSAVDDRLVALETKSADDRKRDDRLKALETRLARTTVGMEIKTAVNDNGETETKAFGTYLRKGIERMPAEEAKSLTVAVGATAGYLAPAQFGNELIKLLVQYSPIRSYAKTVQISGPQIIYPRRTAAIAAQWVSEIAARASSDPSFAQLTITPGELAIHVDVSNQLLEDNAYDLEGELAQEFAETFGKVEGTAFVVGTGSGQPNGLMTSTQIASIANYGSGSNGGNTIMVQDVIQMYHAIPNVHAQNAVWLANRKTLGRMRLLLDGLARPLILDSLIAGVPPTLMGRPVVEAVDMPDVPATADGTCPLLFGDLQGYRIIDRVGLSTLRDPYTLAAVGQTRIHARKRVGGDITHPDRFIKLRMAT